MQPFDRPDEPSVATARAAARLDVAAFGELFDQHGPLLWRLAQAGSPDPVLCSYAVGDGMTRALQPLRGHRAPSAPVRTLLLAGTYASTMALLRRTNQAERDEALAARDRADRTPPAAAVATAFRSLPERWRAAVWLREVEGLDDATIATAMAVSTAVVGQLIVRGRRGLRNRFTRAGAAEPTDLAALLGSLAAPVPAELRAAAEQRWRSGLGPAGTVGRLASPLWLEERGPRPLAAASAAVIALGVIGLGVLGGHAGVTPGVAVAGPRLPAGQADGVVGVPLTVPRQVIPKPGATDGGAFTMLVGGISTTTTGGIVTAAANGFPQMAPALASMPPTATSPGTTAPSTTIAPTAGTSAPSTTTAPPAGTPTSVATPPITVTTTPVPVVTVTVGPVQAVVGSCTEVAVPGVTIPVLCPTTTTVAPATTTTVSAPPTTTTPTTTPVTVPVTVPAPTVPVSVPVVVPDPSTTDLGL